MGTTERERVGLNLHGNANGIVGPRNIAEDKE